ncbi:MAG: hypothetical protein ACTHOJ_17870 [Sphingomonas oligoaromativorans]
MSAVSILPMRPEDALLLQRQPSQRMQLGLEMDLDLAAARDLVHGGEAWTAWRDDLPIACMGLRETFPGVQGVAWAVLAEGIGAAHLAISRHARRRIADSPLIRIEAIVRAAAPAEGAWARTVGLEPEALLRCFGARSEDHVLYVRIR